MHDTDVMRQDCEKKLVTYLIISVRSCRLGQEDLIIYITIFIIYIHVWTYMYMYTKNIQSDIWSALAVLCPSDNLYASCQQLKTLWNSSGISLRKERKNLREGKK